MSFDSQPITRVHRFKASSRSIGNSFDEGSVKRIQPQPKLFLGLTKAQASPRRQIKLPSGLTTTRTKKVPILPIQNKSNSNNSLNNSSSSRRVFEGLLSSRATKQINLSFNSPSSSLQSLNSSRTRTARSHLKSLSTESKKNLKLYLSPGEVLRNMGNMLTEYEQSEILDYKEIYFIGSGAPKIHARNENFNYGYDDEKGNYNCVIGDHIGYRYEAISFLGKGSFGQVLKCMDHKNGELVALKIIKNKKRFIKQGAVEVKVLELLKTQDPEDKFNIVRIKDNFMFRKHLILTFELLSINLYEFLKLNSFEGLSLSLVRRFAIQILIAMRFTKLYSIIHCDLKPENILLKSPNESAIKIIDYGSSCFEAERIYTYIQSRFYRAPEIILGIPYTTGIDIWSFGCIVVELHTGYPLFPGENEHEQLLRIIEVLGVPPPNILEQSTRKKLFFEPDGQPKIVPNSRGKLRYPNTRPLAAMVGTNDGLFLEFVKDILNWDPDKRLNPEEALRHPWICQNSRPQLSPRKKPIAKKTKSFLSEDFLSKKITCK